MVNEELKGSFARDIILMKYVGLNPVVVHGGGPQIGDLLKRLGKEPTFMDGLRVTDKDTMEVVEMVLTGKINKEIVSLINHYGGKAVGLSGKDGNLIVGKEMQGRESMGFIGEVDDINPKVIEVLEKENFIPIIAPVGVGEGGRSYNINADTVAGEIAIALKAEKLILLTDVEGILDKEEKLISTMEPEHAKRLIEDGTAAGGMIPKLKSAIKAADNGVAKTHIIDGRVEHAVLLEIFTDAGIGTQIC